MNLVDMLRGEKWTPPFSGRVVSHSMDEGPRLSENYHDAIRNANRQKVIEAMKSGCECVKSIAEKSGMDYTTAKNHLDKLIASGVVTMAEAKGLKGRKKIYRITK